MVTAAGIDIEGLLLAIPSSDIRAPRLGPTGPACDKGLLHLPKYTRMYEGSLQLRHYSDWGINTCAFGGYWCSG